MSTSERNFARRIDLTSLQLFVAVCELGSIGRAAEREFIAASAISKRLSDLEATLGTTLLYRHARGVDLTPAGESLLHHARSVLYSLEKMQGELSEYADGVRGHVRVHANISAIVQFLPEDLGVFTPGARGHQDRPRGAPEQRGDPRGAGRRGRPRRVPRGGRRGRAAEPVVPARPPRADRAHGHALASQGAVDFIDSLDFDHVGLHTNSSIYVAMHEAALGAGRSVKLRIHVTGLDAMCRMIENGLGIGVMPQRAFELMQNGIGRGLVSVALNDAWAAREIRLVARDFSTLPVAARSLVNHLHAAADGRNAGEPPRPGAA
jgi:DNA-binding transcriptional LysR family regulator